MDVAPSALSGGGLSCCPAVGSLHGRALPLCSTSVSLKGIFLSRSLGFLTAQHVALNGLAGFSFGFPFILCPHGNAKWIQEALRYFPNIRVTSLDVYDTDTAFTPV